MPFYERWTVMPLPEQLEDEENEMVFCSSRPIVGHKTWRSDSNGANTFYAIIDKREGDAEQLYHLNAEYNAIRMEYVSEDYAIAKSLKYYEGLGLTVDPDDPEKRAQLISGFLQRRNKRE